MTNSFKVGDVVRLLKDKAVRAPDDKLPYRLSCRLIVTRALASGDFYADLLDDVDLYEATGWNSYAPFLGDHFEKDEFLTAAHREVKHGV